MIVRPVPLVAHLTASRFFGGPERQMLELARELSGHYRTLFMSFKEEGRSSEFLHECVQDGFAAVALDSDTPHLISAWRELTTRLREYEVNLLCCHGYKATIVGFAAARRIGIPVINVSRGWTKETWRVRLYEMLERRLLPRLDHVVAVSERQSMKVLRCGIAPEKCRVIHNAVRPDRFSDVDLKYRDRLVDLFPGPTRISNRSKSKQRDQECFAVCESLAQQTSLRVPHRIVGAAGRLSPEKGFDVFVDAAARIAKQNSDVGFVIFGEGRERKALEEKIKTLGLKEQFALPGFQADLDRYLPHLDLLVVPSYTEGLPNVALEAAACRRAIVATTVGGLPEVVEDEVTGLLVPPGDSHLLADRVCRLLADDQLRRAMGEAGCDRVQRDFSFAVQAHAYRTMFDRLLQVERDDEVLMDARGSVEQSAVEVV